jgi:hypothetical protein
MPGAHLALRIRSRARKGKFRMRRFSVLGNGNITSAMGFRDSRARAHIRRPCSVGCGHGRGVAQESGLMTDDQEFPQIAL